jgi:hypothetical protein
VPLLRTKVYENWREKKTSVFLYELKLQVQTSDDKVMAMLFFNQFKIDLKLNKYYSNFVRASKWTIYIKHQDD